VQGRKTGKKELALFGPEGPNGAQTTFLLYPFFSPALWRKRRAGEKEYRVNVPLCGPSFLIGL
jgi:hypothetical protein